MASSKSDRNPVEQLAEEFVERYRRGERPALSEYTSRYPRWADEIRELFPALVMMEQLKPAAGDATGAFDGPATESKPLDRLGDYRILREVGRGGMGVVYEAEQESLGRHVALKVLPAHALFNPTYLERFRREARAAAKLHHTNIVPVFGVGECDGVAYYVMQFIRGEGLDRVLDDLRRLRKRDGTPEGVPSGESMAASLLSGRFAAPTLVPGEPLPPPPQSEPASGSALSAADGSETGYYRSVARIGLQAADALAYAHRQGVLHRDVKPSNLLLDTQGIVWITDFGLAKAEGSGELTQAGDIVGTVRYMGPERFDGRSLPQSDVYALGLTLYELLALRPAFDDTNRARLVQQVLHALPPTLRKVEPRVPRDLETIVLRCLAKEPAGRYPTAEALAEDLRRFLADRPILARRASWPEQLWRWCRRNPAVAGLLAAVALLLVAIAVITSTLAVRLAGALGDSEHDRGVAEQAVRDGHQQLFEAYLAEARAQHNGHRPGRRFKSLEAVKQATGLARELGLTPETFVTLRNEAIAALANVDVRPAGTAALHPANTQPTNQHAIYTFDAHFRRYACVVDAQGTISVRRLPDHHEIARRPGFPNECAFRLSPDGEYLAAWSGNTFQVWRLADGPDRPLLHTATRLGFSPSTDWRYDVFSPDSRLLAVPDWGKSQTRFHIFDLASGKPVRELQLPPFFSVFAFRPDGRQLAVAVEKGVQFWDLETGRMVAQVRHTETPYHLAWDPAGWTLAVSLVEDSRVHLWDMARGKVLRSLWHPGGGCIVAFNRSGDVLYTGSDRVHTLRLWHWRTGTLLLSDMALYRPEHFRTTDRLWKHQASRAEFLEVAPGRELRSLTDSAASAERGGYQDVAADPSGRLLAVVQQKGVSLWDLDHGSERVFLGPALVGASWEPAGALCTAGAAGLVRWPVQAPGRQALQLGPPESILLASAPTDIPAVAHSSDGRVTVVAAADDPVLLRQDGTREVLGPQGECRFAAVSPDGSWVATTSQPPLVVHVWDNRTGQWLGEAARLPGWEARFSPDGRWLAVAGEEGVALYAAGTWERQRVIVEAISPLAFSPDGRLLVVEGGGFLRLLEPETGQELARLPEPEDARAGTLTFTPEGERLVVRSNHGEAVRVWDLARLRRHLADLGLDWDALPPPAEKAEDSLHDPLQIHVVGAGWAGDPDTLAEHEGQRALLALSANPFDAGAHLRLGRHLLRVGQPESAYRHLSAALAFYAAGDEARGLRARAAFRLGRWADTVAEATQFLERHPQGSGAGRDLFNRLRPWNPIGGGLERPPTRDDVRYLRGRAFQFLGRFEEAVADYTALLGKHAGDARLYAWRAACLEGLGRGPQAKADRDQALAVTHADPTVRNNLAWVLLNGPAEERDAPLALHLAEWAVKMLPGRENQNTLGLAQYRNARYAEAVATLEKNLTSRKGTDEGYDLFPLAMSYAKLGKAARAKDCFNRAVRWTAAQKGLSRQARAELRAFRTEAEEVLRSSPPN
jgi:serine/threonine protein kinase/WD40 repeat protein/tetratricopeptide (TPR) repeat protein